MQTLEPYFSKFRQNTIGHDLTCELPYGKKPIIYADWVASGRLYGPIEDYLKNEIGPYVANTHTESALMGTTMTRVYNQAKDIIKQHVNAGPNDVLITTGTGMTGAINKLQRMLNLRIPEQYKDAINALGLEKPLILITHMEHHSNQTSWLECHCDIEIIGRADSGLPDLEHMHAILKKYADRKIKIGSFSACSNVTGIITPIHEMAAIMHQYDGVCFADYAASAPYVDMNMHPEDPNQRLDAIMFSPHKFLGGPGSSGVLVFNGDLYHNKTPDEPGGGTVSWTTPWGRHRFVDSIESREDGGTPGFLQATKTALAMLLKDEMGVDKIKQRKEEVRKIISSRIEKIEGVNILEGQALSKLHSLGIISFYSKHLHYNLIVKLLNDRFGIQARGGCSCAGTYGHILFDVTEDGSQSITDKIDHGDASDKPGWIRLSTHQTMTDDEANYIATAVEEIIKHRDVWSLDYKMDPVSAEFFNTKVNVDGRVGLLDIFK